MILHRRRGVFACALLAAAIFGGCAGVDGPRQVVLTPADLMRAMAPRFPLERRLLGVFQVRADLPRLRIVPDAQRLAAEFDVTVDDRLSRQVHRGVIAFDSRLRYEPSDRSVRFDQLRVQRLQFDGLGAAAQPLLQSIGPALAEQLLSDMTVYRIPEDKLHAAERRGYAPSAVSVGNQGVVVELRPIGSGSAAAAPVR